MNPFQGSKGGDESISADGFGGNADDTEPETWSNSTIGSEIVRSLFGITINVKLCQVHSGYTRSEDALVYSYLT